MREPHLRVLPFGCRWIAPAATLLLALAAGTPASAQVSRNVEFKSHVTPPSPQYSACWSYVHSDGREYAAIGTSTGTAIYRLTDPTNPAFVTHIAGPPSPWREMKQYRDWLYVVSEGNGAGNGLQIIRMTNPDAPVLAATYTATFNMAHTVTIDTTNARLYANGTRNLAGQARGMRVLSLANPEIPVEVGSYTGPYVHDSHIRDGVLYTAHINEGWFRMFDASNAALLNNPSQLIAAKTFSNPFPHNAWTSPNKQYLYVTNENNEGMMRTFDISNPSNIRQTWTYRAREGAICHNVHNRGDLLLASHYTEGVRLLDISDPARPTEWGYYDTYLGALTGFHGNWEVCAEYPSGIFIVSDIESGLWVFSPQPNYGIVAGKVFDQFGALVAGASVHLHSGNAGGSLVANSSTTDASGIFRVALDPGSYEFEGHKFGYLDGSAGGTMVAGNTDSITIVLERIPFAAVTGSVMAGAAGPFAPEGAGLPESEIHVDDSPLDTVAVAGGGYRVGEIPQGIWQIHVEHPAYIPEERWLGIVGGADESQNFDLVPVTQYDATEAQDAWSLFTAGDDAISGRWETGDPNGTGSAAVAEVAEDAGGRGSFGLMSGTPGPVVNHPDHDAEDNAGPGPVAPENDHSPAPATRCFVTGLGSPGGSIGAHDVDEGRTTLTSPTLNLSGLADPVIAYYRWFVNDGNSNVDDVLLVQLSNDNGGSWLDISSTATPTSHWVREEIRVLDYFVPTATMRVRFIAADVNLPSVVEAGIDDLSFYDRPGTVDAGAGPPRVSPLAILGVAPNPSRGLVRVALAGPEGSTAEASLYDVRGHLVAHLPAARITAGRASFSWDGRDALGASVPAGIYLARIAAGREVVKARIVRLTGE
ncbi:MAG: choice-of-anchor B family protein [Candidatus Eiseniibacteriota bacterium]